jgi:hypothetical protein
MAFSKVYTPLLRCLAEMGLQRGAGKFLKSSGLQKQAFRGDDAADALRYLMATKSRAVAQRKLRGL